MTASTYPYNLGLRFQAVAAAHGGQPALRFEDGTDLTYAELEEEANRLAHWLAHRGVARGEVVCLVHPKSRRGYAAMLACLKLGAAYANIDPKNPAERLGHVLATCRPRLLLSDGPVAEDVVTAAEQEGVPLLEAAPAEWADQPAGPPAATARVTGSDLAYLMFTSGSTGRPKGVAITHDNVASFIGWARLRFGLGPGAVLTGVNPVYFDNSVFDFFGALFSGACLAPIGEATVRDPAALLGAVERAGCTVWFSVPSLLIYLNRLKVLSGDRLPDLRWFIFGGEGFPKAELARLWRAFGSRARLVNVYGPTECTCICSAHDISEELFADLEGLPPLGRLNENFSGLVFDGEQPVAEGEMGELCLLGPNVGAGYYNMPERTAESFTRNPLNGAVHQTMYRTGDLVRYDPDDGLLYFVGRKDNQIKHMGYRIELEEIEAALASIERVSQAAVVYQRRQTSHGHIVAFLCGKTLPDEQAVRDTLKERLPPYMIPTRFEFRDHLPKNANGKVDRRALAQELD